MKTRESSSQGQSESVIKQSYLPVCGGLPLQRLAVACTFSIVLHVF